MLLLLLFLGTSELALWLTWPLITPTWLERGLLHLTGLGTAPLAPPLHARYGGWATWVPAFLLFVCTMNGFALLEVDIKRACASLPPR